ncbi:hypothetical protein ABFS82_02G078200 [Erythranthe guttata]
MKSYNSISLLTESKSRTCIFTLFITMSLICGAYFLVSASLGTDSFPLKSGLGFNIKQQFTEPVKCEVQVTKKMDIGLRDIRENTPVDKCNEKCRPIGSEALPKGIVSATSNLKMHPLSGPIPEDNNSKHTTSLLALAVGINQKQLVNEIVKKFMGKKFAIMFFHYDDHVDEWHEFEWCDSVIHVSAVNQTKWWFAKRFLHPDIVAEYEYIFLWDEDLGVDNFHPERYLSIIKEEGLEISQPGLDRSSSEIHHQITVRGRRSRVHRRYYKPGKCDNNSTSPPCVGWVEMMAPVFSRAAWRCAWYMIQNDLIHAWGLDMQLGYCAQGDRTLKVGVVDHEYIVHLGLPTLGGASEKNKTDNTQSSNAKNSSTSSSKRYAIRQRSYEEMRVFKSRWSKAVKDDKCWIDPFEKRDAPDRTN